MNDLNIKLYKKVYLIRATEEKIRKHYHEDEMKTPVHLYVGGEAIASGVCEALRKEDQVFTSYRSHGVYLAKTGETDMFFGEMMGKQSGVAHGKAGSMHLSAPDYGYLGASAIVASNISPAVGTAFANKYLKNDKIAVTFFGDGAVDEGAFWESLNLASLWQLPVIFVCEDNDLAIHVSTKQRHGYQSINEIVSKFNIYSDYVTSTDPEVIFQATNKAIENYRNKQQPAFLRFQYYRYYEHVGMNHDFQAGYRSEEDYKKWLKIDPVTLQRNKLIDFGSSEEELKEIEAEIDRRIESSFEKAKKASFPDPAEIFQDVYAD